MSNSQEQSLDEDVVFLPVTVSSPDFLYCEEERHAVERLLDLGPQAFYSSSSTEYPGCFLSSEEVSQITSWAQDCRLKQLHVQQEENGVEDSSDMGDFFSTYFPDHSDIPTPILDLGWPEKKPWVLKGSVTVHTSPPAEGDPPVREIIRRHLQRASEVIAIVTDRLTDSAIINDLYNAAYRGVAVYIILNQRSIQENFTLNRLKHQNIRVRALGGKSFCSRTGRTVIGEMKDKFLLVDLETVIHGSYSLTWTDAHLHRQLITVLCGPVVDWFDREFRILFGSSLPVPDTWRVAGAHVDVTQGLQFQKQLSLEPETVIPSSPSADSFLDWEAMGVVQRDTCFPDSPLNQHDMPLMNNTLFDINTPVINSFTNNGDQFMAEKRVNDSTSPVTNHVPDKSTPFYNSQSPTSHPTTQEIIQRVDCIVEKAISRQLSKESTTISDDRATAHDDKTGDTTYNLVSFSNTKARDHSTPEPILEEKSSMDETSSKLENTPSSRKPIILMVPQSEGFSSLSDILKRFQSQQSTSRFTKNGSKAAESEISRSMMDLSIHNNDMNDDAREVPESRSKACFDPGLMTPGAVLMRKRNDGLTGFKRTEKNLLSSHRPRSSSYGLRLDWRRSKTEKEGKQE
ncbi:protein FAM83A [Echeneis naucrates]|uniref:Protein FAM83A-like n=1 Tax=Echeneis naucrates TaxID=173247 RepID=A0A665UQZ3_ECHNA|nr:protein FAM83A-like [Echeneis naucrates]